MAITNAETDVLYPFVGQTVTINAEISVGNRYRCKLISKPFDSAIELFDDARDNYIVRNRFTPDVAGRYYFTICEETVGANPPRFSNDLGLATGHAAPGEVRGVESVALVSSLAFTVTVGERVTRELGIAPDTVTLEGWTHTLRDSGAGSFPDPLANEDGGLITHYIDSTKSPRLLKADTTPAQIAAQSVAVAEAVRDIGGAISTSYVYGTRYGEDHAIMPWNRIAFDPIVEFGWTAQRFNTHIVANAIGVHTAADVTNTLTDAVGAPLATQIAFLNAAVTAFTGHVQLVGAGPCHAAADTLTLADIPAALAAGSTQEECIDRTNLLWWILDEHLTRIWPAHTSTLAAAAVHPAGDARLNDVTYPLAIDATTAVSRQGAIKSLYGNHIARTGYTMGPYHANVATSAEQYTDALPDNRDAYVAAVGVLYDKLRAHLGNMSAAGVSTAYHTAIDNTLSALRDGKPSSFEEAVKYHETINWILATHAFKGAPVHQASYPCGWRPTVHGIEAVHHAYRTELLSAAATVPPNEVYASSKLVMLGGFKKG